MANDSKRVEFCSGFEAARLVDARQPSGRLEPVFPSLLQGTAKEEAYIERMIARDRAAERDWR